jgi:hypothetical protein
VKNLERGRRGLKDPVAEFLLPAKQARKGPRMPLTLPNFSGATEDHPGLVHYTCKMHANIRPMPTLKDVRPSSGTEASDEDVSTVLKGKPLLCLAFEDLVMSVPEAEPWYPKEQKHVPRLAVV